MVVTMKNNKNDKNNVHCNDYIINNYQELYICTLYQTE